MSTKAERREDLERMATDLAHTGRYRSYKPIELELQGNHPSEAVDFFRDKHRRERLNEMCRAAIAERINEICAGLVADLRNEIPQLTTHEVADETGFLVSDQGLRVKVDKNVLERIVATDRTLGSGYYQVKSALIGILQQSIKSGGQEAHITHDDLWPTGSH